MTKRKWKEVNSDNEFAGLFANAHIVQATTNLPDGIPARYADIYWELSDGTWLSMEISTSMGCPTCGPETEKNYGVLAP
jgi:hypothetical protein